MDFNFSDEPENPGGAMDDEMEEPEIERIPCRLYPVQGEEQSYVIPVPGLEQKNLEEFEYHVDELEKLLELVCHFSDGEGQYYGFHINDEQTMERALKINTLIPISPEKLGELLEKNG